MLLYYDFNYPASDFIEGRSVKVYLTKTEKTDIRNNGQAFEDGNKRIELNKVTYNITEISLLD